MPSNSDTFLNKVLGEDFFEELSKTELWKPRTKSVVDIDDMRIGLKIVPRAILSFLIRELVPMEIGENKEVKIPMNGDARLVVTKHERDQFSGDVLHNNKKETEFKFRSLPGVGLVIMSTFEMYNLDELDSPAASDDLEMKVQRMIDERISLHNLIEQVVDRKLAHKEAIHNLMLMKLTHELQEVRERADKVTEARNVNEQTTPQSDPYFQGMTNGLAVAEAAVKNIEPRFVDAPSKDFIEAGKQNKSWIDRMKKKRPLAEFLEKKQKPKEFAVQLAKGEEISCPDCGKTIFNESAFSGCVCLGADMDKKLFIKKSESGVKVRFSRGWDPENISLLLEVLQKKNG